jgi:hypothetical protein
MDKPEDCLFACACTEKHRITLPSGTNVGQAWSASIRIVGENRR